MSIENMNPNSKLEKISFMLHKIHEKIVTLEQQINALKEYKNQPIMQTTCMRESKYINRVVYEDKPLKDWMQLDEIHDDLNDQLIHCLSDYDILNAKYMELKENKHTRKKQRT